MGRLSPAERQVAHVLRTRSPVTGRNPFPRLACVKHAASVRPEPGSNSPRESSNQLSTQTLLRTTAQSRVRNHLYLVMNPLPTVDVTVDQRGPSHESLSIVNQLPTSLLQPQLTATARRHRGRGSITLPSDSSRGPPRAPHPPRDPERAPAQPTRRHSPHPRRRNAPSLLS